MKTRGNLMAIVTGLFLTMTQINLTAQEETEPRFSHKGVKVALGTASFEMIGERELHEGDGGMLSVGYGFTQRFSLWLTFLGSEHRPRAHDGSFDLSEFGGVELNLQHRFETDARFQPYGKVGFGIYGLEMENDPNTLIGAGINLGFGIDYFFAKHFAVGAELMWKKLDYVTESRETPEGQVFKELKPHLNGDTSAFMLTFTIQ